ncbi:hypothetical protein Clacol_000169 [Clathrus columnatus]|uniref:Uncharacterized protein n=1 Tax=Clathrus columnatus TaxID=1419009 RepID=A0AAV4ZY61_9AGAM|nr:hypothetical protein Clacol_000169 [Clathrus columnatus]
MTNIPTNQGTDLDIDFITIGREIGPPGFTGPIFNVTVDDKSPFVAYNGSWSSSNNSPSAFGLTLHSTIQESSSVSVFFQGSSIELYGPYVNAPFQAHIDSQLPVDLAGLNATLPAEDHPGTLLFLVDGLEENKTHVATLVNSASDSNRSLYFDFAIVRSSQQFFENTPSPNPKFTIPVSGFPTSTNTSSSPSNVTSPSSSFIMRQKTPTGTIIGGVVGGVVGLVIFAFIAFILFRRSKHYRQTTEVNAYIIPPSDSLREPNISTEPISFMLPVTSNPLLTHADLKSTTNSNHQAALSQQSHLQTPSLTSSTHGLSQEVSSFLIESIGTEQLPSPNRNLLHGNSLIAQTYILQEQDAGRLVVQTILPPIYDGNWQNDASL